MRWHMKIMDILFNIVYYHLETYKAELIIYNLSVTAAGIIFPEQTVQLPPSKVTR